VWQYRKEDNTLSKAITPTLINFYERKGWIAQRKRNGTCSTANVDSEGKVTFFTRHGEAHKAWTPTAEAKAWFGQYPDSYFVFELLHSKGAGVRDTIYLFDVLRMEGTDQVGFPLRERLCLLQTLPVSGKISVARTYTKDLTALYRGLSDPLDEGIVLKDPEAVLAECHRGGLNANWQVKCRRATKNFGF
jgi:ATP-dependent DNA ligase